MNCINCFNAMTYIQNVNDPDGPAIPKEGDLSICFTCGTLYMFDKELNKQLLTLDDEIKILSKEPNTLREIYILRQFIESIIKQN